MRQILLSLSEALPMSDDLSFGDMLNRLRREDRDAANQLFQQYVARLIGLARRRLHEGACQMAGGPDDVVQSVLQSFLLRHAEAVDLVSEDSLWDKLLAITWRHCDKWNKRWQRFKERAGVPVPIEPGQEPSADEPTPEEAAGLAEVVERLMSGLSDRQRQIFQLRLQGYSVAEISAQIQLSSALVYRIMGQLREHINKHLPADA
jgi:RNA polymerase sigma factor (sigma-70 family)